jgi:hypothetical protein
VCIVDYCTKYPNAIQLPDVNTTDPLPIQIDSTATYKCNTAGQVIDDVGESIELKCGAGGIFELPSPLPTCRAPGQCTAAPPDPSAEVPATHLVMPGTANVQEFRYVEYLCEDGYSLWPVRPTDTNNVKDNTFKVQCGQTAVWPSSVTWPHCVKKTCDTAPATLPQEYSNLTALPVVVGDYAVYKCTEANKFTDDGKTVAVLCKADGTFDEPTTWLPCRAPALSAIKPQPNANRNFQLVDNSTVIYEFSSAEYKCVPGKSFGNGQTSFILPMLLGAVYETDVAWPMCTEPDCGTLSPPDDWSVDNVNPLQGESVTFTCTNTSLVTSNGKSHMSTCDDGTVTMPPDTVCRLPAACTDAVPVPPTTKNLQNSASTVSKEFEEALYVCQTGFWMDRSLPDLDDAKNVFILTCGAGGTFPATPSWPTCNKNCKTPMLPPATSGLTERFKPTDVRYKDKHFYKCLSLEKRQAVQQIQMLSK